MKLKNSVSGAEKQQLIKRAQNLSKTLKIDIRAYFSGRIAVSKTANGGSIPPARATPS